MATIIFIGAAIRPQAQPSAIVVTQLDYVYNRVTRKRLEYYSVRFTELIAAHTDYPKIALRIKQIVDNLHLQAAQYKARVILYADVTGLGQPIVDLIKARVDPIITCYMTANDKRSEHQDRVTIGKAWLIAKLQTIFQDERIYLPPTESNQLLVNEILAYSLDPSPTDNELAGSFTVGTQDQLLTALGLACQGVPEREKPGEEFLEYMRRRMFHPTITKPSKEWLKEWYGNSPVRSVDPLTGKTLPTDPALVPKTASA